jgi:hypothetical protein
MDGCRSPDSASRPVQFAISVFAESSEIEACEEECRFLQQ